MKYKAELLRLAVRSIQESGLKLNEIVRRSGVARSKVSAVKNGATVSVSCDLLVKIIIRPGFSAAEFPLIIGLECLNLELTVLYGSQYTWRILLPEPPPVPALTARILDFRKSMRTRSEVTKTSSGFCAWPASKRS